MAALGGITAGIEPLGVPEHLMDEKPEMSRKSIQIHDRIYGIDARVDPTVTFEEYQYWAKIERAEEHENNRLYVEQRGPKSIKNIFSNRFSHGIHHENKQREQQEQQEQQASPGGSSKEATADAIVLQDMSVSPEEWKVAARALRTASWGTVFYLITTDILGWSGAPFVFSSVGYGPAIALYIIFGIAAGFSGWILWRVFLGLDSSRYPMLSYGDPFFRVYGIWSRHFINVTQSLQQFMTVCVLILASAQVIAQLSSNKICFMVCMVIFMVVGMITGLMRSLQHVGWLANASVWMNIASFLIIMIASAHFGIDYDVILKSTLIKGIEPIKTFAGPPPNDYQQQATGFAGQFNGINNMVYSYGGALLFIAFLAEMRHPWDFWKSILVAQSFICVVYIFFGAFVYSQFGQYSASNIGQVILPVGLQTAGNVLGLVTAAIACLMYFNIGMKTVYIEVFQAIFKFPTITTRKGRIMWFALGPIYWALGLIVAAAVPNLNGISGLVGALLILNFTYTFPAILYIGYRCQVDAALPGEGFDPVTGTTTRHDTGLKRWVRGYKKNWHLNTINVIYFCGGLATSGMGTWAAIEGLIAVFGPGGTVATSFGCAGPV